MHFSVRETLSLFALLAASASALEPGNPILDGIFHKRQVGGTAVTTATDTTADPTTTTGRTTITTTPSTTFDTETTSTSTRTTTSNGTPTTVTTRTTATTPTTSPLPPTTTVVPTTSMRTSETTSSRTTSNTSRTTITSAQVTAITSQAVTTIVVTENGAPTTRLSTSAMVIQSTTGFATITTTPGLADGGSSGGSTGLSSKAKGIIGGVVGGIGGAILLGGIALVCWRIWGRKRNNTSDYDDVRSEGTAVQGSGMEPKRTSGGVADDESHFDRYTQPAGRPNAAANF
ncbi:hypothetical protein EJ08DRAFT_660629 [Tothia fuscella]|uniref:Mid2 domain-containing protein n=1 Tax=Tothia fuscella TaxID=1048955 RepID=A0A9P4NSW1_9PEZI|nr:hypothetical protein EJ08DRAFT_660629 [Tothia fuscella]